MLDTADMAMLFHNNGWDFNRNSIREPIGVVGKYNIDNFGTRAFSESFALIMGAFKRSESKATYPYGRAFMADTYQTVLS